MIWKEFCFQAINNYNSFFYTAFLMKYTIGCPNDDCLSYLRHSLVTTFASLAVFSFIEMGLTAFKIRWAIYKEDKDLEAAHEESGSPKRDAKRSSTEMQGKRLPYVSEEHRVNDYLKAIISMGYVFLFGAAAPSLLSLQF
jgi:hypothetical protein